MNVVLWMVLGGIVVVILLAIEMAVTGKRIR
jgi:hypothetical protein